MLLQMRTTLNLDSGVMTEVKRLAARRGTTLTAVIEEALRIELLRASAPASHRPVALPTDTPTRAGLLPGVDLDDTADLLDHLDRGADPDRLR
jgi:hypothetical protein